MGLLSENQMCLCHQAKESPSHMLLISCRFVVRPCLSLKHTVMHHVFYLIMRSTNLIRSLHRFPLWRSLPLRTAESLLFGATPGDLILTRRGTRHKTSPCLSSRDFFFTLYFPVELVHRNDHQQGCVVWNKPIFEPHTVT